MNKPLDNRRGLGRGIDSFFGARATSPGASAGAATAMASEGNGLMMLPISQIEANPTQPRQHFDLVALNELAASITANGVIQPLVVRRKGDGFELVAGERRWRASKMAGLAEVPVVVQEIADDKVLEIALIENIQRADLNPIETATAFSRLVRELNLSHEEVGQRTGKERATITNFLRLLKLPDDLQQLVAEARLTMGQAKALLGIEDQDKQRELAQKAMQLGLSVRAVEKMVQNLQTPPEEKPVVEVPVDPNVAAAVESFERVLGTRVRIIATTENRGRIEIDYYSQAELQRIYEQIVD
ncbi:MAG: ParB/RepB/Spo0J family partition protein [Bryobacteraceae bacterium]|nr:ParB/RepB/Spo0J family partition protein [Bryobacteraceae bacterium]